MIACDEKIMKMGGNTSNKKPPKARTNANGPAKSVSCKMEASVSRRGFSTESVCEQKEIEELFNLKS